MEYKRFESTRSINKMDFPRSKVGLRMAEKFPQNEAQAQLDPLSISHVKEVLDETFRNCSKVDLKNLRFVCKLWNVIATRILQDKSDPIRFTEGVENCAKMIKIVSVLKDSVNPSCVKFEISSNFFTLENENLLTNFFQVCGPFLEYLTISTDRTIKSKFEFTELLLKHLSLPKLKSLVFEDRPPREVETQNHHDFSTFFNALMSSARNLEKLDISLCTGLFEPEGTASLSQLPVGLLRSRTSQQLKHLEISAKLTDPEMICLSRSGLQLKTLHFRVRNVSLHESSFKILLESQSSSLEELKLTEEHLGSDFLVKFPKMKKLIKITIVSICEFENSIVTFAPFGYQEKLPNLKSLNLWNCFGKEQRWNQFFFAKSPSLSITKLELPTQFRNATLAKNISVMFPMLKKLKIGFCLRPENCAVMKIIFETLTDLEELDLRTDMDNQNENIDHVLTGLPHDVCRRIRVEGLYDDNPSCLEGVQRMPSLVNMKNLRRLEIVLDNKRAPFITDVSAYLAFMKMPKLRVIRFTRYGMSKECSDALANKFRLELLPPNGSNLFEMEYLNMDFD